MACPGCGSQRTVGERVVCCDQCGRTILAASAIQDIRAAPPPDGVRKIESGAPSENADPYRQNLTPGALLEAEIQHDRRRFGPGVLGFGLSVVALISKDRVGLEMAIFFAVVGIAAIVVSLIPRREQLRVTVTRDSLLMGREGVPRSRWAVYDANALSEVFVRAQARTTESARRYDLVAAFEDGSAHVLLPSLKTVDAAQWLAVAIEDALGFEDSAMQADQTEKHVSDDVAS